MPPLRISMVGLSSWESVFVQTTVDLASGIDIARWSFVNDPAAADVLLVDADRSNPKTQSTVQPPDGPIVVSFSADPTNGGRGLTRPVSYADLISVLKDIEGELGDAGRERQPAPRVDASAEPSQRPDTATIELTAPNGRSDESLDERARPAKRFVERTRLIGLLKQIQSRGEAVEIAHPDFPAVQVFPAYNAYATPADSLAIPRMYRESALSFATRHIDAAEADELLSSDRCKPLGWLVYSAALFGSEGRLVLNSNPADKLTLIDWPDFDAVPHLAEHRTIAKYMLVHTDDLANIAASTRASIGVVIDFCNACEAAGLLRRVHARGPEKTRKNVGQLVDRMRGLFGER